jgi:hypothetical protein
MNPVIINCFLLYVLVILLSLFQSRFRIFKDDPFTYTLLLIFTPLVVLGKAKGIKTWPTLTAFEIFGYTLMVAYTGGRRIVPKINEGYIYAYTLLHWYLLYDAIQRHGFGFWNTAVLILSIYPTFLCLRSIFQHRKLEQRTKIVLYYWCLFTVVYAFISQIAQSIIHPILTAYEVSWRSFGVILFSAVQLYFISTLLSLLWLGIPLFHMERSGGSFSQRWRSAVVEWRELLAYKLDGYIEYQINTVQVVYITSISAMLFWVDASYTEARPYVVVAYTIFLPLVYFYFKAVPEENLENPFILPEEAGKEKVRLRQQKKRSTVS